MNLADNYCCHLWKESECPSEAETKRGGEYFFTVFQIIQQNIVEKNSTAFLEINPGEGFVLVLQNLSKLWLALYSSQLQGANNCLLIRSSLCIMFVATELARIPLDNIKIVNNSICEILEAIWEMDMHQTGQQTALVWMYNKFWSAENEKCAVFCYHSFLCSCAKNRWSNLVQSSLPLSAWSMQGHSWHNCR